ncbi:Uncharacterised protein [Mycobacteroides abscessus subsp. abscessus]|nr:Uncharacterised protein [Mycobacteroides abscessus subsp. abscessus]
MQHPGADLGLARVDSRGTDLHQHLVGRRNWARHVAHLQDVDTAVLIELHRLGHSHHSRCYRHGSAGIGGLTPAQPKRPEM